MPRLNKYHVILRYILELLYDREHAAYDNKVFCYADKREDLAGIHEIYENDYSFLIDVINHMLEY